MRSDVASRSAICLFLACSVGSASAKTVELRGQMGFLGEWEIAGQLTQSETGEVSGPLSMKHTGLCTHDGPVQKQSEIRYLTLSRSRATIAMDGTECAFNASKSGASDGILSCPNATPIPMTLNLLR